MIGALLGKYRVLSKLGEGGMGVVYVGRHETLGHSVVVKVLQPELSRDTEMVRRFFNEAQAATAIRNLGIVQVFDFGTTPDGRAYFVMELLEGQNLAARLKQRRLGHIECCRIGRQIANVLQAAHARGITHRDLKPENLFLVPDTEAMGDERVKVLDFGIAKLAGEVHAAGVRTRTGMIMGTPHYMSPEQCRGAGTVDARSDIYSLGCILFEISCGRPPFVAEGAGELLGAHQFLDAPRPQSLVPDMPPGLGALIVQMLAKLPDARPQTMAAVSQTLDEILQTLGAPRRAPTPLPVPLSTPSPASMPRPAPEPSSVSASTTFGASAGASNVRASRRARRFPFVVGGVVVAVAVPVLVLELATSAPGSPDGPALSGAAVPLPADAATPDAARLAVGPPPPVEAAQTPPPSTASPSGTSPRPSGKPEKPEKPEKLASKGRVPVDAKAAPGNPAVEAAMQARNLKQAKTEPDAIPAAAPEYAPEDKQAPDCDHEQLAARANSNFAAGKLVTAIEHYQAAWDCKPEPRYAESAFFIACQIPSVMKAKLFWHRLSPSSKSRALPSCVRNGIAEDTLNAP
jgi:serine/threonine protein kinase